MADTRREYYERHLNEHDIPPRMWDVILRYLIERDPPGHFLTAVLMNDLKEAVARGDDENLARLANYVRFFYNHAPAMCWGSEKKVTDWLNRVDEMDEMAAPEDE